jgi:ERCC4-type nuclease
MRESDVYEACQYIYQIQNVADAYCPRLEIKPLLLGDMEIQNTKGDCMVLFERKSIPDLIASIKDGRYNEQSYRLHHACSLTPHNIVYIIEGSLALSKYPPPILKMVRSALTSLQFIKGFSVIRTQSVKETAEYLMDTATRLASKVDDGWTLYYPNKKETDAVQTDQDRDDPSCSNSPLVPSYATVVKACKKQNVTYQNIHIIMLSQIPGISPSTAEVILNGQTLEQMINRLRQGDNQWLFSIKVSASANIPPRKLSKSVIHSIYLYFFNTPPPSSPT